MDNALDAYRNVGTYGTVDSASPHRLIELLIDGALQRIATAKGHMQRKEVSPKGELIGKALKIVDGLRLSLDRSQGGDLATRLDDLYEYMGRRLLQANLTDDTNILDEVSGLLHEIKDAWARVPDPKPKAEHGRAGG